MRALYDIDAAILACVDQETGEIFDPAQLDALQMERAQKLEGVALWVKDLKAEAEAVKAEADKLNARKKAIDNKVEKVSYETAGKGRKVRKSRAFIFGKDVTEHCFRIFGMDRFLSDRHVTVTAGDRKLRLKSEECVAAPGLVRLCGFEHIAVGRDVL